MPALALGLTILAMQQPKPLPPLLQGVRRIVCMGDSITQGGDRPGGYVWLLRANLASIYPEAKIEVFNAGISGNKCTDMLARFQRDVLDRKPDLLTLSVGVNDVWHGFYDNHPKGDGPLAVKLADYRANVAKLVSTARAQGIRVVLLEATPIGEDFAAATNRKQEPYNSALRDLAKETHVAFVPLQPAFRKAIRAYREATGSTQDFLTTDGVHMNPAGYQVMAQSLLSALGVPDGDRLAALGEVAKLARPDAKRVSLPSGRVVSDNCPATTNTIQPGYEPGNATLPYSSGGPERWCAASGDYDPNPWWQVDLGQVRDVTGVQLFFAPADLDSWKYRVETSLDGKEYRTLADAGQNKELINQAVHIAAAKARYVRVVFVGPTAGLNWASLHRALVFADSS